MGDCPGLDASLGSGERVIEVLWSRPSQRGKVAALGITLQPANSCCGFRMKEVSDRDGGTSLGLSVLLLDGPDPTLRPHQVPEPSCPLGPWGPQIAEGVCVWDSGGQLPTTTHPEQGLRVPSLLPPTPLPLALRK